MSGQQPADVVEGRVHIGQEGNGGCVFRFVVYASAKVGKMNIIFGLRNDLNVLTRCSSGHGTLTACPDHGSR